MAAGTTIKIKRKAGTPYVENPAAGELLLDTMTGRLWTSVDGGGGVDPVVAGMRSTLSWFYEIGSGLPADQTFYVDSNTLSGISEIHLSMACREGIPTSIVEDFVQAFNGGVGSVKGQLVCFSTYSENILLFDVLGVGIEVDSPDSWLRIDVDGVAGLSTPFSDDLWSFSFLGAFTAGLGSAALLTAGTSANNAVQLNGSAQLPAVDGSLLTGVIPTGSVIPFAGSSAPSGWLLANGSAVSRTTYASLFTAIGTTYGAGDGSTTFNLPDMGGRVPAGKEATATRLTAAASGVDGGTLGATGGSETHTLTESEMPTHTHVFGGNQLSNTTAGGGAARITGMVGGSNGNSTASTTSVGGDSPHNNVQPTLVLNYIIKT